MLYLASDHAGFGLKTGIIADIIKGRELFIDLGCYAEASCDYPDFAHRLADRILKNNVMGIATCSSGIGMSMALNRHAGIKTIPCHIAEKGAMGVAICGSGIGMSMALNRHAGIRAALCHTVEDVVLSRKHNDANVLVLAGRQISLDQALLFLKTFLETPFEGGRHLVRVGKIEIG